MEKFIMVEVNLDDSNFLEEGISSIIGAFCLGIGCGSTCAGAICW